MNIKDFSALTIHFSTINILIFSTLYFSTAFLTIQYTILLILLFPFT